MKTFLFTSLSFLLLFLTSCVKQKDLVQPTETPATTPTSFATIKSSDNFTWSTTKRVDFRFEGVSTEDYRQVLKVLLPDGSVLFQKLQIASEDFQGALEIPAHMTSLLVSFGNVTKTVELKNNTVTMTIR